MAETDETKVVDVVTPIEQSAEQAQSGTEDVVSNAKQLYDEVRHLPQTIKEGVTETYRQMAAPYRQNLTGDVSDMVTISEKTTTVTHTPIAQVRESVPQMFNDFINQNYTEEQQQAIRTEMSQQLADNNGTCTFVWKDKEEKDSAKKKDIIVSTEKSLGTGTDIKGLRCVILGVPIASRVLAAQMLGRLREFAPDKDTYFFDIIDKCIAPVNWYFNSRFKKIKLLAKEVIYLNNINS